MNADKTTPYGTKVIVQTNISNRKYKGWFIGPSYETPNTVGIVEIAGFELDNLQYQEDVAFFAGYIYDYIFIEEWLR